MDNLPNCPIQTYATLRQRVQSGDLLLCSGTSLFSTLIQRATNSVWSHVGFILRIDAIDRVMVLESVESIGVRAVPLSHYVYNYNGSGMGYAGKILLARHADVKAEHVMNLSRSAVDFLGYPYRTEEIVHIAARLSLQNLGVHQPPDPEAKRAFICSEYAQVCFESIGIQIEYNRSGFIAPADFANHPKIKPLYYLAVENKVNTPLHSPREFAHHTA